MTDLLEIEEQYAYSQTVGRSMSKLEKDLLAETIEFLKGMGCEYYIVDPSGEIQTNLEKKEIKQRKKRVNKFVDYVTPFLESLEIGKLAELPYGYPFNDFTGADLQGNISARAIDKWGAGSLRTYVNKEKSVVEVIRKPTIPSKNARMEL